MIKTYLIPDYFWKKILNQAKNKNKKIEITKNYISELLFKQNFRCAISNMEIQINLSRNKNSTASLDRINSNLQYVEGNVQWVHKDVNFLKNKFDEKYLLYICKLVSIKNQ